MISNPRASHSTLSSTLSCGCIATAWHRRFLILKTISGSIFGRRQLPDRERCDAAFRGKPHGVVVHVRPDQRAQLEYAPHCFVRVADFETYCLRGCPHDAVEQPRLLRRKPDAISKEVSRLGRGSHICVALRERNEQFFRENAWVHWRQKWLLPGRGSADQCRRRCRYG